MLIIIWRGYGLLLATAAAALGVLTLVGLGRVGFSPDARFIAGWLVTALALWFSGRAVNDPGRDKTMIDVDSGESVLLAKRHSLYGIQVQYMAALPLLMAILTTVDVLFDI